MVGWVQPILIETPATFVRLMKSCVQHVQEAINTFLVACVGEIVSILRGLHQMALRGQLVIQRATRRQLVRHFFESGLDAFLQGLRNRLFKSGVQVLTIKPGFVDTPMTAHIPERGPLWAQPEDVAQGIVKAIEKKRDVVYLPGFWALIMLIIRSIPELVFKRLSL